MDNNIKEYKRFTMAGHEKAKEIVSAINLLGGSAKISVVWMDYGAGIAWDTILVKSKKINIDYQALTPREFDDINHGTLSIERIKKIVMDAI